MQSKKIYLAVPITGNSVGDLGALSSAMFARELLMQQNNMVKVQCVQNWDALLADVAKVHPSTVCIVEGIEGKTNLEVYHQVLPDWDRYEQSYKMASDIIFHSRRLRKLHNRHVQAGYMMQWMQTIQAPAVYVRLCIPNINMDELWIQGRALALSICAEN